MSEFFILLLQIVSIALVAALSPTTFAVLVFSLSLSKKPKTTGVGFFVGSLIVILIAVLLGFLATDGISIITGEDPTIFNGWINIVLSILLIVYGIKTILEKDNKLTKIKNYKNNRSETSEFFASMLLAMGIFTLNFITTILVIYATSEIVISNVNWSSKIILTILLVIITLLLVEIPVLVCFKDPIKADDILSRFNNWIQRNGYILTAALLLILGFYLLSEGLTKLNWI